MITYQCPTCDTRYREIVIPRPRGSRCWKCGQEMSAAEETIKP